MHDSHYEIFFLYRYKPFLMLTIYTYHTIISYTVIIVFVLFYYSLLMVDRDISWTES